MPGRILRKIKERVRNIQLQRAKQLLLTHAVSGRQPFRHVKEGRIHQQLDHFNRQDVSTFPQVKNIRQCLKYLHFKVCPRHIQFECMEQGLTFGTQKAMARLTFSEKGFVIL